ncbi:MAG TPA: threonine--tRNA ligase [Candidatus Thermoplasmatota archaeon]|nr:threonine--tRNA ligase [Candidatus Thermoplasmatota archaeon]
MRLLFIHADSVEYEAKKPALKGVPELPEDRRRGAMTEALVVYYSVEAGDEADAEGLCKLALQNIKDVAGQVKVANVALYPYAHLSSTLAKPQDAMRVGETLVQTVRADGSFALLAVPFGYYKSFSLKAKGHPLAELARTIRLDASAAPGKAGTPVDVHRKGAPEGALGSRTSSSADSEAVKREKTLQSTWYVLTPAGELVPAASFDFSSHRTLEKLYRYESAKVRATAGEPPHVKLMREQELVDYEPGSDSGNFRWYPKGQLVKRLLEEHVSNLVARAGAMRVETPIMYDYQHPALSKYLQRFPARQYTVQSEDKEFFLRFAACFGQYLIGHDMTISYKHLPLRLYELTHYSFRREQSGEVAGLKRLRAFTMPDMHTMVADVAQAKEEFEGQFRLSMRWMDDLGVPYEAAVRFVRSFYEENKDFAATLPRLLGRPVLVEMWDERFFYFVTKFEFNVVDTSDKASALSTVQIDVENGERFGIAFADASGQKRHPLLLHTSISGSVDRNVYAFLENEARKIAAGQKPAYPFWLAPTQVRLLPVRDEFVTACEKLAESLPCRADVDDRDEGIGRKIRDAEKEWVPLTIVYGEKEAASGKLPARLRDGTTRDLTFEELARYVVAERGDRPQAALPLPRRLSLRPAFRG